jgi:ATP-dependent Clp protease adaptor protein ClpS
MGDYRAATVVGKTAIGRLPAAGKIMRCSMRWGGTLRGERIEWMTPCSRHVTGRCPELIVDCATMSCQNDPDSRSGSDTMSDSLTKPRVKTRVKTERPKLHKVILINDDFTPREFVVTVLKGEFHMTEDQAYRVMITAHQRGVCVVAVFTKDVAETKATRATEAGKAKGYPLMFTTEPEE